MATSSDILCGICEAQYINKFADHWCPECEEGLCGECQKHHSISKGTRSHEIISVENYKRLPTFISNIVQHCKEHDAKFQHYCRKHDQLCCPVCVSVKHKKCEDLSAIQEIVTNSKSSALLDNMKHSIGDMKINIENLIQDRKENLTKIKVQRQRFYEQIKLEREQINSRLDTLEHQVTKELDITEKKISGEIENVLQQLTKKQEVIDQLGENIKAVEEYASDLQSFLGSRTIEKDVEKEEIQMKLLQSSGSFQTVYLKCTVNTEICDFLCNIISFLGSLSVARCPSSVVLNQKEQQAQIMVPLRNRPVTIADITLKLQSTVTVPAGRREIQLRGCVVCPNGKIAIADGGNERLVVLNCDGTIDREWSVPEPNDITLVDDTKVAMTTSRGIDIINLETKMTDDNFPTVEYCYGITFYKGMLIYCHAYKGIEIINMETRERSYLQSSREDHWTYVTSFEDNIYHSNHWENIVTAYKLTGEIKWTFRDKQILKDPRSMTTDNNGNLYVTSPEKDNIIVISHDGKLAKPLPTSEDGNRIIMGIHFDKKSNTLIRIQSKGTVYIYKV